MRDCARLTRRPTRLDFRAALHGPFSKRATKARDSQRRSLNACCGPLSSRHAPARSWWNTSRKSPSASMVGAGDSNSDLPFACATPSQARRAPMKRDGEGAKKCLGGARPFLGQCVRARRRTVLVSGSSMNWLFVHKNFPSRICPRGTLSARSISAPIIAASSSPNPRGADFSSSMPSRGSSASAKAC